MLKSTKHHSAALTPPITPERLGEMGAISPEASRTRGPRNAVSYPRFLRTPLGGLA